MYLAAAFGLAITLALLAVFFGQRASQNLALANQNRGQAQIANTQAAAEQATALAEGRQADEQRIAALAAQSTAEAEAVVRATAQGQAEAAAAVSFSRELAAAAANNLDVDPERSILLSLHALSQANTREAIEALHQSVLAFRTKLTLAGHADFVFGLDFSPDGKRLVTASGDHTAKVWDAETGQDLLTLAGHSDAVNHAVFSPDGRRIATASDDGTAKVGDAETGQELLSLVGSRDGFRTSSSARMAGGSPQPTAPMQAAAARPRCGTPKAARNY